MDFVDRASLDAYGPHPQHKLAAAKVLATFVADTNQTKLTIPFGN